jgi:hypothetical protein
MHCPVGKSGLSRSNLSLVMMVSVEILIIGVALLLQPLFGLLYAYGLWRLGLSWTGKRTGQWFDNRVETVSEELKP